MDITSIIKDNIFFTKDKNIFYFIQNDNDRPGWSKAVDDYLGGQKASLNFLVGQVMRLTRGKADPGETVKLLKENIE